MGALCGLLAGLGLLLLCTPTRSSTAHRPRRGRLAPLLSAAGITRLGPRRAAVVVVGAGLLTAATVLAISRSIAVAIGFGALGGWLPIGYLRGRAHRRRQERRDLWPDVADNLLSAVRAGMALPEAVVALGERGPEPLRPEFVAFARDYRTNGRFVPSLDRLKDRLADPAADRLVEALRVAREVGGGDLGQLLRNLSSFLRDDARVRAELEARQSWTVNAARLALLAPWVVLGLLSLRPQTVAAYDSAAGVAILLVGGGVSVLAYRLMLRIARLPDEERIAR